MMKLKSIPTCPCLDCHALTSWLAASASPLVLTDVMHEWPAMQSWSFEYFAREFADFPVVAHAPQFPSLARWGVRTTLARYVEYLNDPKHIEGEWTIGDLESLRAGGLTLYAGNFNPAHPVRGDPKRIFAAVPELPDFIESWLDLLEPRFARACARVQSHHFVYLSIAGGVTPLHHDFWDTHAFLAQISGTKRALLFDPEHMAELYAEPSGDVPRMLEDPRYEHVTCWSTELSRGQMLIIPSRWLHWVETLSPSVTYSVDWIDGTNWRAYVDEATRTLTSKGVWP